RSTGFFVSQVFEQEGRYDAHLAVVTPPYDRRGRPQPQSCLFAGRVATVTVDPWPSSTLTYYVSSTHPSRDDAGPGTSPDAPLATIEQAMKRLDRPNTRILLRRGEQFPFSRLDFAFKTGPILLGAYGDPAGGRPTMIVSTRAQHPAEQSVNLTGSFDLRIVGVALRDTGETGAQDPQKRPKMGFYSAGLTRLLLIRDNLVVDSGRFYYIHNTDRAVVLDRNEMRSRGDYTLIAEGAHELSATRNALD